MRFVLCLLIWILVVGGLWGYTRHRDAGLPENPPVTEAIAHAEGNYLLEITPTFSVEEDPFALQSDSGRPPSIELRLNGHILEHPDVAMNRGNVMQIRDLPELLAGFNEIYISVSPPLSETHLYHGVRVRLADGEKEIVDRTLWAGSGANVSGAVSFEIATGKDAHDEH
jgi:hypothetical protein